MSQTLQDARSLSGLNFLETEDVGIMLSGNFGVLGLCHIVGLNKGRSLTNRLKTSFPFLGCALNKLKAIHSVQIFVVQYLQVYHQWAHECLTLDECPEEVKSIPQIFVLFSQDQL
jgi:hypothetical protein